MFAENGVAEYTILEILKKFGTSFRWSAGSNKKRYNPSPESRSRPPIVPPIVPPSDAGRQKKDEEG